VYVEMNNARAKQQDSGKKLKLSDPTKLRCSTFKHSFGFAWGRSLFVHQLQLDERAD